MREFSQTAALHHKVSSRPPKTERSNTFGHSALEGEPNVFRLYLKNRSGSMSVLEQDVSDQVHDVPVAGHIGDVHLVLNFDYEVPSEPGNGGPGFDVDVDDWDDVNMDIVL